MIYAKQYEPLLDVAKAPIRVVGPTHPMHAFTADNYADLSFKTVGMFEDFKHFCKAQGIKTRRLANAPVYDGSKDRMPDNVPFAKRLRVAILSLCAWLEDNTDAGINRKYLEDQMYIESFWCELMHSLSLLTLATISDQNYSLYTKKELPYSKVDVTIYQVDDKPLDTKLSDGQHTSGPVLVPGIDGEWEPSSLRSLEGKPLSQLVEATKGLNSDLAFVKKLMEDCKNAEPLISNRHRQTLPGVDNKQVV